MLSGTMTTALRISLGLAVLAGAFVVACTPTRPLQMPLTGLGNIDLAPDSGPPSIDLLTVDPRVPQLYVPHRSRDLLEVIYTITDKGDGGGSVVHRPVA